MKYISTRNFCCSVSLNNITNNESGDFFQIELEVKYPPPCATDKVCKDHFMAVLNLTVSSVPREVIFRVKFTNGTTLNVRLALESFSQIAVTNTTSTTTTTTKSKYSQILLSITQVIYFIQKESNDQYFRQQLQSNI
jgi:hypothetical protein